MGIVYIVALGVPSVHMDDVGRCFYKRASKVRPDEWAWLGSGRGYAVVYEVGVVRKWARVINPLIIGRGV